MRAGQHPPPAFLNAIGRWECAKCEALHSVRWIRERNNWWSRRSGTKALSKACMLLTSSESPNTVDIPTEMKKLHPEGERFALDYIPSQLNFSSSDVWFKLRERQLAPIPTRTRHRGHIHLGALMGALNGSSERWWRVVRNNWLLRNNNVCPNHHRHCRGLGRAATTKTRMKERTTRRHGQQLLDRQLRRAKLLWGDPAGWKPFRRRAGGRGRHSLPSAVW